MQKTWKPTVAGILEIVVGALSLLGFIGILIAFPFIPSSADITIVILTSAAVSTAVLGVLSLISGIFAIQRKKWGLAIAGSIAALFLSLVAGVLAVIFTAMSKDEFES